MTVPTRDGGDEAARRVVVATRNQSKLAELAPLTRSLGLEVVDLAHLGVPHSPEEDALETSDTFEGNAIAKARFYHAATRLPAIADDSGLCVTALGGAPGVHSRRWAGVTGTEAAVSAANNAKLLASLPDSASRAATFVCVLAYAAREQLLVARGEIHGRITRTPRGVAGFGYDPLFAPDELDGRTFAECAAEDKARVSHRARAVAALAAQLLHAAAAGGLS